MHSTSSVYFIAFMLYCMLALSGTTPRFPDTASELLGPVDRAQFNFLPYQIREACLNCARQNTSTLFDCEIDFSWFDPNSVKENNVTSCYCSYHWKWDGQTTTQGDNNTYDSVNFIVCINSYPSVFEMRVNNFTGPSNLTLFMSHFYKDSSLWGAPYLYVQTWAMPTMNLSLQDSTDLTMKFYAKGPVFANITGLQG